MTKSITAVLTLAKLRSWTAVLGLFTTTVLIFVSASSAQSVRTDTPSGFQVPRFVSLKSNKTNCRIGPTLTHPVKLTFLRKGLPVRVVAETLDHWRKIEDYDGDQCWVHATLISGKHTAIIIENDSAIRAGLEIDARIRAKVEEGVLVSVRKCENQSCLVKTGSIAGWISKSDIWGFSGL